MSTTKVKALVMLEDGRMMEYTAEVTLSRYNPRSAIRKLMIKKIEYDTKAKVVSFDWMS